MPDLTPEVAAARGVVEALTGPELAALIAVDAQTAEVVLNGEEDGMGDRFLGTTRDAFLSFVDEEGIFPVAGQTTHLVDTSWATDRNYKQVWRVFVELNIGATQLAAQEPEYTQEAVRRLVRQVAGVLVEQIAAAHQPAPPADPEDPPVDPEDPPVDPQDPPADPQP